MQLAQTIVMILVIVWVCAGLFVYPISSLSQSQILASDQLIETKQIILSPSLVDSLSAYGQYKDQAYTNYYKPQNLFDNAVTQDSWWSQFGKAGFNLVLKQPLQEKVCNIDIDIAQSPQNSPFKLTLIGANNTELKSFTGNLSENVVKPDFEETCVEKVKGLKMDINEPNKNKSNKIAELRLFTYINVQNPPPEPHICPNEDEIWDETQQKCIPIEEPDGNITKITITNSTAELDIANSDVTINIDKDSALNLPNLNVPIQTVEIPTTIPVPTTDPLTEEIEEEDEEDEEDDNDDGDKKKK